MKSVGIRPESLLNFSSMSKLPVILQTEASECGLACIAMVAAYHGFETDLTNLRRNFAISSHGATLKQVMDIASRINLSGRALRLDIEQLDQLRTPCILHWDMKHFVVLKKVTTNGILIHDPSSGERSVSLSDTNDLFTGVALELTPTPEFERGDEKHNLGLGHFWSRIRGLKRSLLVILILALLLQFFSILSPYYMQTVVDDVILRKDTSLLAALALGFSLLLFIQVGTSLLREFVLLSFSSKLNIQMSANVFHHLIRLPMDYFATRHMGDIVSRFGSLKTIRNLLTTGLIAVFIDGLMAIITLAVMYMYDTTLTFIVIGVVILYALLRFALYKPIRLITEEQIITSAKESSHFMESIRAAQTIKLFGKESDRENQWQNKFADSMNKGIQLAKWNMGFSTANKLLFGFENIFIVYFAATAVMDSLMSVGMMYAFMSYKGRFVGAMDSLIAKWIEFRMLDLHFNRLADIVLTERDSLVDEGNLNANLLEEEDEVSSISGQISVDSLDYSYSELESAIFKNVTFSIEAGETVAIVGPSGSGKTTLLKCLMGITSPTQGSVLLDGKAFSQQPNYRKHIAGVMQDEQLLSGTILENIVCFDENIDFSKAVKCAEMACIHNEILDMAMQYNTLIGDMGSGLSGGQQQRIVLARAFYRQPKILFMDEATSHLDVACEQQINENIKKLSITRVIVAHRPETIKLAQRVFLLEGTAVQELTPRQKDHAVDET